EPALKPCFRAEGEEAGSRAGRCRLRSGWRGSRFCRRDFFLLDCRVGFCRRICRASFSRQMDPSSPLQTPARVAGFAYDAFGSYSTGADYRLVRRVEGFLESFHRLPKVEGDPLPELAICVDGSDFSVAKAAAWARREAG